MKLREMLSGVVERSELVGMASIEDVLWELTTGTAD